MMIKGTQSAALTASSSSQAPTYYFALSNSNIGTGFFDQYRIHSVRFTLAPLQNAIGLTTNSTTTMVPVYCVIDYDDASALGSAGAAQGYTNCVVLEPGESLERVFVPQCALAAYSGAFTSYATVKRQWLDAASSSVQHYGVKLWIPADTAGQTQHQSWQVIIEMFIEVRKII